MVRKSLLLTALYAAVSTAQMLSPEEVKSLDEKGCKILCAKGYAMKGICSCDETGTSSTGKKKLARELDSNMNDLVARINSIPIDNPLVQTKEDFPDYNQQQDQNQDQNHHEHQDATQNQDPGQDKNLENSLAQELYEKYAYASAVSVTVNPSSVQTGILVASGTGSVMATATAKGVGALGKNMPSHILMAPTSGSASVGGMPSSTPSGSVGPSKIMPSSVPAVTNMVNAADGVRAPKAMGVAVCGLGVVGMLV